MGNLSDMHKRKKLPSSRWTFFLVLFVFFGVSPDSVLGETPSFFRSRGAYGDGKFLSMKGRLYFLVGDNGAGRLFEIAPDERGEWSVDERRLNSPFSVNWLSTYPVAPSSSEALLLAGSFLDKRMRVYRFKPRKGQVELLTTLTDGAELAIDPAVLKTQEGWLATYTTITEDESCAEKRFTVYVNRSDKPTEWKELSPPLSKCSPLEDVRLFSQSDETGRDILSLLFEEEMKDRGPSSIRVIRSNDGGRTWGKELVLLEDGHDNEPAGLFVRDVDTNMLFYSSDRNAPGKSYLGGEAFFMPYSLKKDGGTLRSEPLEIEKGILLIDTFLSKEQELFTASIKNYGTEGAELVFHHLPWSEVESGNTL